jgi:hypothetical protein
MTGMCVTHLSLLKYMLLGGETSRLSYSQQKGSKCVCVTKERGMFASEKCTYFQ